MNFLKKIGLCQFLDFTNIYHHCQKKKKKKKIMSSYWEKHSTDRNTENGSFTGAPVYRGSNKMDSC